MSARRLRGPAILAIGRAFEAAGLSDDLGREAARVARFSTIDQPQRVWHRPILGPARQRGVAGITLGVFVYVARHTYLDHWPLVVHEVAHVAQFVQRGVPAFLARYALQYLQGRARGMGDHQAYLALPDEVEARAVEAQAGTPPAGDWWAR